MLPRLVLAFALCAAPARAADRPVVVELFTSQGCSSCPPADAYLTELARTRPDVLPLAFHVTYWNRLGWRDAFSLEVATERQARYGAAFGDGSYTPEIVVDGHAGFVGSRRGEVEPAIAAAKRRDQSAAVALERSEGAVSVSVGAGRGSGRIVLVGYDPEHVTAVGRGENAGRSLIESNVVRSIRVIGQWSGAPVALRAAAPSGREAAVLIEAPDGGIVGAARSSSPR